MGGRNKLTTGTSDTISSQLDIDLSKFIAKIVELIYKGKKVEEIRLLSYAYTNKTALVRLNDKNATRFVVKICIKEDRYPKLNLEHDLILRLASETDLPVPKIIYKDLTATKFKYPFIVYSFLPGENLADAIVHIKNKKKLGSELAKIASKIHKLTFDRPQLSLASEGVNSKWVQIIESICKTGIDRLKSNNYSKLKGVEDYIHKNMKIVSEPSKYFLVHRDLQPQNLHWDNNKEEIVGVFDFESAMSGDHHFEFNFLERKLFKLYPEIRETFYKEYSKHNKLEANYKKLVKFYEVVRDLYFYDRDIHYGELERADGDIESIERLVFHDWKVG